MRYFLLFLALALGDDEKAIPVTGFYEGDVLRIGINHLASGIKEKTAVGNPV